MAFVDDLEIVAKSITRKCKWWPGETRLERGGKRKRLSCRYAPWRKKHKERPSVSVVVTI